MKISVVAATALIGLVMISACSRTPTVPKTAEIVIEKIDATDEWRPSTVAIARGGNVTWNNTSTVLPHSVISGEGLFNVTLAGGESFTYTFTQNGTFTYSDAPNPVGTVIDTVGTINVK